MPATRTLQTGENVTFFAAAEGSETMTLQWQKDGVDISEAKGAKIVRYYRQYDSAEMKWYKDSDNNWCYTLPDTSLHLQKLIQSGGGYQLSREQYDCGKVYWNNPFQLLGLNFYAVNGAQSGNAGSYTFKAVNRFGSASSRAAVLTVQSPPVITTHPRSQSVVNGNVMWFTGAASGSGLSYQWKKNGVNIADSNSTTYTITKPAKADTTSYRCVVSNADGQVISKEAKLTVLLPPEITINPVNATASAGNNLTFTAAAKGPGTLTYQWQKDGVDINNATQVHIAQHIQKHDNAVYKWLKDTQGNWCRMTADGILHRQRVVANNTGGVHVQNESFNCGKAFWNDPASLVGRNLLAINSVTASIAGSYKCIISNTLGSTTSSAATLTVE